MDDNCPSIIHSHGMNYPPSSKLDMLIRMTSPLVEAAGALARNARRQRRRSDKKLNAGATLRPGPDTPLWNELARAATLQLKKRGEKVRLARVLGVSRQRLHLLLVSRTACPDAERALLLVLWLSARRAGRDLA